jgi:Zn-finger nucleic acid-binding protein
MKCPNCKEVNLVMSERQGVEIDYCPDCRGVWLDRGELDKIIEKSAQSEVGKRPSSNHFEHKDYKNQEDYNKQKRKGSWMSDLFD